MGDILKATEGEQVTFSARSEKADHWMRQNYSVSEEASVVSELPSECEQALDFQSSAQNAGLNIDQL